MASPLLIENEIEIDRQSFDLFREILCDTTGISLSTAKVDLAKSRLRRRLAELELRSLGAYTQYLSRLPRTHSEWQVLINAMTTNKTGFFREPQHFVYFRDRLLPELVRGGRREPAIWSAACSTGEEPYTIAMVAEESLSRLGVGFKVVASDIDTDVLRRASNGVYRRESLADVPPNYLRRSFVQGTDGITDWFKVRRNVKQYVKFQQVNLINQTLPWRGEFDVIFCRNVLIYFNAATVRTVVEGLFRAANIGATLFIGHSESLQGIQTSWKYVGPSLYRKTEG